MRWSLAVLLAVASVAVGTAARAPAREPPGDAFGWFAARGFVPAAPSRALGGAEGHRLHLLVRAEVPGCAIALVPADSLEEVLPVLRREIPEEVLEGAGLWFGALREGVPSPAALHAERLLLRLRGGAVPLPAIVLAEPACAPWSGQSAAPG